MGMPAILEAHHAAMDFSSPTVGWLVPTSNGSGAGQPCTLSASADLGPFSRQSQQPVSARLCPVFHNAGEDSARSDCGCSCQGLLLVSGSLAGRGSDKVCGSPSAC